MIFSSCQFKILWCPFSSYWDSSANQRPPWSLIDLQGNNRVIFSQWFLPSFDIILNIPRKPLGWGILGVKEDFELNSTRRKLFCDEYPSGFKGFFGSILPTTDPLLQPLRITILSPSLICVSRKVICTLLPFSRATNCHVHFCSDGNPLLKNFGEMNNIRSSLSKPYV